MRKLDGWTRLALLAGAGWAAFCLIASWSGIAPIFDQPPPPPALTYDQWAADVNQGRAAAISACKQQNAAFQRMNDQTTDLAKTLGTQPRLVELRNCDLAGMSPDAITYDNQYGQPERDWRQSRAEAMAALELALVRGFVGVVLLLCIPPVIRWVRRGFYRL
jgi:hypothetical protein